MDLGISGRRAAVAAASDGLGLACARALVEAGCHVAICGRDGARVDAAAAALGERAMPLVQDVTGLDGGRAFVQRATEALGGVDILVTNAGGPPAGTFADVDDDAYQQALELNLLSVVGMCRQAVPDMTSRGFGRVVAITSISVRQPIGFLLLSNTARAGATGFLKSLAREVASDGVTVNSVQPGVHATARLQQVSPDDLQGMVDQIPVGRPGDPDDFGRTVAFLASVHAGFITGAAVPVDGGAYAGLQ